MLHRFANPARFSRIAAKVLPWSTAATIALFVIGLYFALFASPADFQQGETVRIMYVHVPSAWISIGCYTFIAVMSAVALIWKHPLADIAARAAAPLGAGFTLIVLITGSLWGKPTWGTWWVWDARLTSVLVLFFLYLAYIALANASSEKGGVSRVTAIFGIVGAINIPIINRSVIWWNSLHQPASITVSGSSIDSAFLWPLMVNVVGFSLLFGAIILMRMRMILAQTKVEARLKRMAAE